MPKATLVRAAGRVNESNVSALSADPRDVVAPSHDRGRTASVPASHSDCGVPDGDVRTIVYPVSRHGPPVPAWLQRGFRPYPALVAQGIERRFPKPCVAGSNPAGGTQQKPQFRRHFGASGPSAPNNPGSPSVHAFSHQPAPLASSAAASRACSGCTVTPPQPTAMGRPLPSTRREAGAWNSVQTEMSQARAPDIQAPAAGAQTTAFLRAASRNHCALSLGVRSRVSKSTYTRPKRVP